MMNTLPLPKILPFIIRYDSSTEAMALILAKRINYDINYEERYLLAKPGMNVLVSLGSELLNTYHDFEINITTPGGRSNVKKKHVITTNLSRMYTQNYKLGMGGYHIIKYIGPHSDFNPAIITSNDYVSYKEVPSAYPNYKAEGSVCSVLASGNIYLCFNIGGKLYKLNSPRSNGYDNQKGLYPMSSIHMGGIASDPRTYTSGEQLELIVRNNVFMDLYNGQRLVELDRTESIIQCFNLDKDKGAIIKTIDDYEKRYLKINDTDAFIYFKSDMKELMKHGLEKPWAQIESVSCMPIEVR